MLLPEMKIPSEARGIKWPMRLYVCQECSRPTMFREDRCCLGYVSEILVAPIEIEILVIPEIVIYYTRAKTEKRESEKIAKAAFANVSDAFIYWNALTESRKHYLVMETLDGEPVEEVAHTGYNDAAWAGYYSHATAITEKNPLPSRTRDRDNAKRSGWKFEKVGK